LDRLEIFWNGLSCLAQDIAIERQHAGLEHQALLTREMSHRLKNSLTSVVGLIRVQVRRPA
jgi:two-component sensor histidine kinase